MMTLLDPRPSVRRQASPRPIGARVIPFDALTPPVSGSNAPGIAELGERCVRAINAWSRRYGAVVLFFLAWQLASRFELVDPSVIPSFTDVIGAIFHGLVTGKLLNGMMVSLARAGVGFGIAVGAAIPLGLFMGSFQRFEDVVDSLLQLFRQTSALAIYPIFILLLGLGETSKVAIICWAAFFPVLLNTISGVKLVDRRLIEMARIFGASRTQVFRRVVVPAALPAIFVGLRLSATISLLLLVAAEMIGAKQGLGFLIINSQYNFDIPMMFAAIVLLASVGLAVNYALLFAQRRLCRWENPRRAQAPQRWTRKVGLVAAVLAAIVAAGPARAADNSVTIRYFANRGAVSGYELADALGYFKDKGIKLESEGFSESGPENLVALSANAIDVAGVATAPLINAIAAGAKVVGVIPDVGVSKAVSSKFYVLADSPIRVPEDLKDKSVAVNTLGAHLDYTAREYLRVHSLPDDYLKLISVPGPQLDQILRHKQADVVAVGGWQAIFSGKIESEGGVRVLFTDYDVLGDITLSNDAMKRAFIDAHPQAVKDFVTQTAQAIGWSAAHPDEARKLFAEILQKRGDNPELAQYWPGYGLREHALYAYHDAQFWIDALVRGGRLKPGQLAPEDVQTNRYNDLAHLAQQ
jgi:ABC-type nitrate/sulfonate/bicarbonate transport system permease component/ABC-type nitrate/sulfonate/bicarbonate transport system substrate-binding protein